MVWAVKKTTQGFSRHKGGTAPVVQQVRNVTNVTKARNVTNVTKARNVTNVTQARNVTNVTNARNVANARTVSSIKNKGQSMTGPVMQMPQLKI